MNELKTLVNHEAIQSKIFTIRGKQVMLDRDLAELFEVETKRLNEQVKRNTDRFPAQYCFQLTESEKIELVANCDRFNSLKHTSTLPYAFTEAGVAMLSAVLRSKVAINMSIQIIDAFINIRRLISENTIIFNRLDNLERHQNTLIHDTDQKFAQNLRCTSK